MLVHHPLLLMEDTILFFLGLNYIIEPKDNKLQHNYLFVQKHFVLLDQLRFHIFLHLELQ